MILFNTEDAKKKLFEGENSSFWEETLNKSLEKIKLNNEKVTKTKRTETLVDFAIISELSIYKDSLKDIEFDYCEEEIERISDDMHEIFKGKSKLSNNKTMFYFWGVYIIFTILVLFNVISFPMYLLIIPYMFKTIMFLIIIYLNIQSKTK